MKTTFGGFSADAARKSGKCGPPSDEHCSSDLESSMSSVRIEQKAMRCPRATGLPSHIFITVANIDRSADFYEKVFGGGILSRGDSKAASGHIQIANTWQIVNVGGGPPRTRIRSAAS